MWSYHIAWEIGLIYRCIISVLYKSIRKWYILEGMLKIWDNYDPDFISYFKLVDMVKDLGYESYQEFGTKFQH